MLNSIAEKFDFTQLIAPLDSSQFFRDYWEQQPLLLQGRATQYYSRLFSIEDVDSILSSSKLKPPEIRVVKNQQELLPSTYINADGSLNLNQLYKAYDEDHTLIFNGLQQFWQPLAVFCQRLQNELNHLVVTNLYLSPQNSKGLMPHFDTHDVFVLQIQGSKHWSIHRPIQPTPLLASFQPVFPEDTLGEPDQSICLNAGDLLYIPRGFIHHANTTDSFSLHITIGVYPAQWFDLIVAALTTASLKDVRFRKALPVGYLDDPDTKLSLKTQLYELVDCFLNKVQVEEALELMEDRLIRQITPAADGHFSQLNQLEAIHLDSTLVKRSGMRCRIIQQGFNVSIQFPGNTIKGPGHIEPALRYIINTEQFAVQDLPALGDEAKLTLVRRLVRGGLLQIV